MVREIDLKELLLILLHRIWFIVLSAVVLAAVALAITHYGITPQYEASVKLYVNNSVEANTDLTSSDVTASKSLVDTYITIIQSDTVLEQVIEKTGVDYSPARLVEKMTAGALNNTEVFRVTIRDPDPEIACKLANAIAETTPAVLAEIVTGSSVKIVDTANTPTSPSSPSYSKNIAIGLLAGIVLSCAIVILLALLDTRIKSEADISRISTLPVLGAITEFHMANKAGYGYGYGYGYGARKKSEEKGA